MIAVYDYHADVIEVNFCFSEKGFTYSDETAKLMDGYHGNVYPAISASPEAMPLLEKEDFPIFIFDRRKRPSPAYLKFQSDLISVNYDELNNKEGLCISGEDLQITQVHIDPDLLSGKGVERVFGQNLDKRYFYDERGDNDGQTLCHVLENNCDNLQILGLFEFYAHMALNKSEADKVYKSVEELLNKAGFSPKHLAIDPQILKVVPDLEGIAKTTLLPDYTPYGTRLRPEEETKLYELEKVLVIAKSHYSAVMTYNLQEVIQKIRGIEQKIKGLNESGIEQII